MKKYHSTLAFIIILGLFFTSSSVLAQSVTQTQDFLSKTTFRLNTNFFTQNSESVDSGHLTKKQNQLFYSNPFFGLEMDYAWANNFTLNLGISYSGAKSDYQTELVFVVAPDPDALTSFNTQYRFSNISFEPKAKLVFDIQQFSFFWSAGPILSAAFLISDFEAAPYKDPRNYSYLKESYSSSIGFGGQASTGLQYFFSKNIGVSAEIGYKYLQHNTLQTQDEVSGEVQHIDYKISSVFQRAGFVIKF